MVQMTDSNVTDEQPPSSATEADSVPIGESGAHDLPIIPVPEQITDLGGANWAPYMHPSGQSILFASNHHSESGRQFNIFKINIQ